MIGKTLARVLELLVCPLVAAALAVLLAGSASAQFCGNSVVNPTSFRISTFTASSMSVANYNPFSGVGTRDVTITATSTAACAFSIAFYRTPIAAVMSQGGSQLSYGITSVGGGNSYIALTNTVPAVANRIDVVTTGAQTITRTVQVRIPANQVVADGAYSDTGVIMVLLSFNSANNTWYYIQRAVTPAATVPKVCRLDAPSPATLAFAATDIPNGVPNSGVVRSSTMTAACTAPTIVRLTGSALVQTPAAGAVAGFDSNINYRAIATFGAATATLNSTAAVTSASSVAKNVASGATASGNIGVNVNLVAGNPVIAGSYSSVLTVTIDPNL